MQVWVAVNEADIGNIRPGSRSHSPSMHFPMNRSAARQQDPSQCGMTQNVVTYTVEVVTDNSSGRLLPYLTPT